MPNPFDDLLPDQAPQTASAPAPSPKVPKRQDQANPFDDLIPTVAAKPLTGRDARLEALKGKLPGEAPTSGFQAMKDEAAAGVGDIKRLGIDALTKLPSPITGALRVLNAPLVGAGRFVGNTAQAVGAAPAVSAIADAVTQVGLPMLPVGKMIPRLPRVAPVEGVERAANLGGAVEGSQRAATMSYEEMTRRQLGDPQHTQMRMQLRDAEGRLSRALTPEDGARASEEVSRLRDAMTARDYELQNVGTPSESPPPAPPNVPPAPTTEAAEAAPRPSLPGPTSLWFRKASDELRNLAPETRSAEAKLAHEVIGEHAAKLAYKDRVLKTQFRAASRALESVPPEVRLDFVNRVETGASQDTPELQRIASDLREVLDARHKRVSSVKDGTVGFIENYFPHIWKDPDAARDAMGNILGKRPLEGPRSFMKQRTIPTIKEGIEAGLQPVSDNPIDLVLLKAHEMDRYVMAHDLFNEMKGKGLVEFVRGGEMRPGMAEINDRIAKAVAFDPEKLALTQYGRYVAPEPVANILNNYLSPGFKGRSAIYDATYGVGSPINMARLALSGFHLTFETLNDLALHSGMAFGDIGRGLRNADLGLMSQGAGRLARTYSGVQTWKDIQRGSKLLRSIRNQPYTGEAFSAEIEKVLRGGGRFADERTIADDLTKGFREAFRDKRYLGATKEAFKALPQAVSAPVMRWFVPRIKLGAFLEMAEHELALRQPATLDESRAVLNHVSDHIDNLFGQLVRDNIFWSRKAKDLLDVVISFPGWNIGSFRTLAGPLRGSAKLATGNAVDIPARMETRYLLGLTTNVALLGAITQYLWTGQWPTETKDYFYPRTGRTLANGQPERKQYPTYLRDAVGMATHPIRTVSHKVHPIVAAITELSENMNYSGVQIRDPNAGLLSQGAQVGKYLGKFAMPFSIQNLQRSAGRGPGEYVENWLGINPVPQELSNTPAMNAIAEATRRRMPAMRTEEEAATSEKRRNALQAMREETTPDVTGLTPRQRKDLQKRSGREALVDTFTQGLNHLPLGDAMRVYQLGNSDEKAIMKPLIRAKLQRALKAQTISPEQATAILDATPDLREFPAPPSPLNSGLLGTPPRS